MFRSPYADALIALVIVLLFLGPKRLPGLGRSLGEGMREFKDGITGGSKHDSSDREPAAISPGQQAPSPASQPASTPASQPTQPPTSAGTNTPPPPAHQAAGSAAPPEPAPREVGTEQRS